MSRFALDCTRKEEKKVTIIFACGNEGRRRALVNQPHLATSRDIKKIHSCLLHNVYFFPSVTKTLFFAIEKKEQKRIAHSRVMGGERSLLAKRRRNSVWWTWTQREGHTFSVNSTFANGRTLIKRQRVVIFYPFMHPWGTGGNKKGREMGHKKAVNL